MRATTFHSCTFKWGDGTPDTVVQAAVSPCRAAHAYDAGTYALTVEVADDDGGHASAERSVLVYAFDGFFAPVDNPPRRNLVTVGQAIPVKFSLRGDHGRDTSRPVPRLAPGVVRVGRHHRSRHAHAESGQQQSHLRGRQRPLPLRLENREGVGGQLPAARHPAQGRQRADRTVSLPVIMRPSNAYRRDCQRIHPVPARLAPARESGHLLTLQSAHA